MGKDDGWLAERALATWRVQRGRVICTLTRQIERASPEMAQNRVFLALEAIWTNGDEPAVEIAGADERCFAADVAKYMRVAYSEVRGQW